MEKMTERDEFYYGKGYADGRKELGRELLEEIYADDDLVWYCSCNDANSAICRIEDFIKGMAGVDYGSE